MWFYKPEWEKGCDVRGETFKALDAMWTPRVVRLRASRCLI